MARNRRTDDAALTRLHTLADLMTTRFPRDSYADVWSRLYTVTEEFPETRAEIANELERKIREISDVASKANDAIKPSVLAALNLKPNPKKG